MKIPLVMSRKKATAMMSDVQSQYTKALNSANNQVQRSNREKINALEYGYGGGYLNGATAGQKYAGGISGSGSALTIDHYSMRQNARRAVQESLEARAIIESFASNVIGTGLKLDPTPNWDLLGISSEDPIRVEWPRNAAMRYDLYANDKKQHRSGNLSWYQLSNTV